jgi:hypothetical protein
VDDQLVLEKEEAFDLSYPSPVTVFSTDSPIDVKSVTVRSQGADEAPRE